MAFNQKKYSWTYSLRPSNEFLQIYREESERDSCDLQVILTQSYQDQNSDQTTLRPKSGNDDRILQIALDGTQGIAHAKAKVL